MSRRCATWYVGQDRGRQDKRKRKCALEHSRQIRGIRREDILFKFKEQYSSDDRKGEGKGEAHKNCARLQVCEGAGTPIQLRYAYIICRNE